MLKEVKVLKEEVGNLSVTRVIVRAVIPLSISTSTVRRVMRKGGLK